MLCKCSPFKKWHKKAFLRMYDFSFLQTFTTSNLSIDEIYRTRRGGIQQRKKLLKCEFYSVAAEEIMTHSERDYNILQASQLHKQNNIHVPFPRDKVNINVIKAPTCMKCSLDEGVMRSVIDYPRKKSRNYSRRLGNLSIFADPNFIIVAQSCCPVESRMDSLPLFKVLSCFEIAHREHCKYIVVEIERKDQKGTRSLRKHPMHE